MTVVAVTVVMAAAMVTMAAPRSWALTTAMADGDVTGVDGAGRVEGVGAAFGNGVYTRSGKARLTYIIRRNVYLYLFYRIKRNGLCICLSTRCWCIQTKWIIKYCTVK